MFGKILFAKFSSKIDSKVLRVKLEKKKINENFEDILRRYWENFQKNLERFS